MRELRIGDDTLEAVILPEVGARLHRLRAFGHDLLRTPVDVGDHGQDPFFWGAYVMAPWCNRVAARPLAVGDATVDLLANFTDGTAIHGQVYARPWALDPDGVTCRCRAGGDGWPWAYEVSLRAVIEHEALTLRLGLANLATTPMPAGLGIHPWWLRPLEIRLPGRTVYPSNAGSPPHPEPARGPFDLGDLAEPAAGLDATWTELAQPAVELAWPKVGLAATMALSASADHVVVATPVTPDATAVEVQTHAPDGLRRLLHAEPGALRWLAPGAELSLELGLTFRRW